MHMRRLMRSSPLESDQPLICLIQDSNDIMHRLHLRAPQTSLSRVCALVGYVRLSKSHHEEFGGRLGLQMTPFSIY